MAQCSSGQDPKKTLTELYRILKENVQSFADDNHHVSNVNDRLRDVIQQTVQQLQPDRYKKPVVRRSFPESKDIYEKESRTQPTLESMENHELQAFREKVQVQKSLCKTKDILQVLEKKLPENLDDAKAEDSEISELLLEVKCIISECLHVQSHTDVLVEKISIGVQKLLDQRQTGRPKGIHGELLAFAVPAELSYACGRIQKKGVNFRQFGTALNISDGLLDVIQGQYEDDEDELFRQVIREWARVSESVNIRDLVAACHSLGGTLVKEPLSKKETDKLLRNVTYLCENMMDVPLVLPHLVSTLVLSPGLCEYIVAPAGRIERIIRLVDILCIRKNGLEEFCVALKKSEQDHVAAQLTGLDIPKFRDRSHSLPIILDDTNEDTSGTRSDDGKSSGDDVLQKIVRLLSTEGFIKQ